MVQVTCIPRDGIPIAQAQLQGACKIGEDGKGEADSPHLFVFLVESLMIVSNLSRYKAFYGVELGKVPYNRKLSVDIQRPRPETSASSELSHGQRQLRTAKQRWLF